MKTKLFCLVMAGGQGTRFWPESNSSRPKQFLSLVGESSLLTQTLNRFDGLIEKQDRYIVTVKQQEELALKYSKGKIGKNGLIFEPSGRNTAPCILLSLATLLAKGASMDDVVVIVASDHVILNQQGFQDVVKDATKLACYEQKIITIGIPTNFPHTGYGYIKRGKFQERSNGVYEVEAFKEKPDLETACAYVKSGEYFWNAGMFVTCIGTLLEEFKKHAGEIYQHFGPLKDNVGKFKETSLIYDKIAADSIDYSIIEKSNRVMVISARFDWNDLGSWDALEGVVENSDDNVVVSDKDHYFDNSSGNIISANEQFVSLVNVSDLIIVSNDKVLMVLPKKDAQKVKSIVEHLKANKQYAHLL
ncbi:MAG: mannose-1-phosphate guanylyltransferase [Bacteriovoracaceae bacterium]|nr:mannose-1-phosphate guanylyltransferase [Bacteriovoracaceae bacterium]